LYATDLSADFIRRFRGLLGQAFDFRCHNGKAFSCFTRTGCFNGRIECQQVCLASNVRD
jgi:hypothetical protein